MKSFFVSKAWSMKEGFLLGGGLVIVGLLLQWLLGPVTWDAFAWPVNGIVLAAFLLLIAVLFLQSKRVYALTFLGSYQAAVPALCYAVLLTVIMGFGLYEMLSFWPLVLIYVYVSIILGLVVLRQLRTWAASRFSLRAFRASLLLHLGLFVAMTSATLGSADVQRLKMLTVVDNPEWRALTAEQQVVVMPFTISLKKFIMETYPDGKPKRFASEIVIAPHASHPSPLTSKIEATVDVNKPIKVGGWMIYQFDYDAQRGTESQVSLLELVSDPWLPLVYAGIYMLLAGAVLMMLRSIPWKKVYQRAQQHPKRALSLLLLTIASFVCIHHFMPILHSNTLVPALQSPWFVPHIVAYMFAYTLMATAAISAIYLLIKKSSSTLDNLVYGGLAFMTVGMLFGALWAKEAWGHYWAWDPKETWAAITWFAYLVYVHYRKIPTHKPKLALWALLISFVLLQMCWWGINYLPSAQKTSVHTYNKSE